jgi:hypothetical protein
MAKLSKDIVTTYLSDTTIHGCKYTVERELFVIERICWAIIVFIFFLIVFGLIRVIIILIVKYSMSTGCAMLFGGNINYVHFSIPIGIIITYLHSARFLLIICKCFT